MTDPTRPLRERWQILALDTGSSMLERSMLTYTRGFGELVSVPRVMWVLRGPTTVVIDTSVPRTGSAAEFIGEDFSRTPGQDPRNALAAAGVDPHDVEFVLLTHLHWDHAGNCDLFPEATVLVQEAELRYAIAPGRFFRRSFLSPLGGWGVPPYVVPNLDVVKGAATIAPGLRVEPAPGHTPGSQAVVVSTDHGVFAIAGDAVTTYENVEDDIPPGFHTSVDEAVESIDRLAALADSLLPSHDQAVFTDGPVTQIGAAHAARGRRPAKLAHAPFWTEREH
jgi:glyoxylase-like metal-dependent hydrolase (beta-lactamase superfamily II)